MPLNRNDSMMKKFFGSCIQEKYFGNSVLQQEILLKMKEYKINTCVISKTKRKQKGPSRYMDPI